MRADDECYEFGNNGQTAYVIHDNISSQLACDDFCVADPRCLSTTYSYRSEKCYVKDRAQKRLTVDLETVHQPKYCRKSKTECVHVCVDHRQKPIHPYTRTLLWHI